MGNTNSLYFDLLPRELNVVIFYKLRDFDAYNFSKLYNLDMEDYYKNSINIDMLDIFGKDVSVIKKYINDNNAAVTRRLYTNDDNSPRLDIVISNVSSKVTEDIESFLRNHIGLTSEFKVVDSSVTDWVLGNFARKFMGNYSMEPYYTVIDLLIFGKLIKFRIIHDYNFPKELLLGVTVPSFYLYKINNDKEYISFGTDIDKIFKKDTNCSIL